MCSINRVSSEPPAHRECAEYAVRACPFLARPNAKRNTKEAMGDGSTVPGIMVQHNPGAILIWITKRYRIEEGLFYLGQPTEVHWYAEGRKATRAEIDAAMAKGVPFIRKEARRNGWSEAEIDEQIKRAEQFMPAE